MNNVEKFSLAAGGLTLSILLGLVIQGAMETHQMHQESREVDRPLKNYNPSGAQLSPGLGETPGYPGITPEQKARLHEAAQSAGMSDEEAERIRVQGIHAGMYPEDAHGGREAYQRDREASRRASGWYDNPRQ